MKTKAKQPEAVSHTIQGKNRAAKQADMHSVLQKYAQSVENGELRVESVQRQADNELDDEDLLQGKFTQHAELKSPPLGGWGATAQREALEDEDLLQGKFEAAENGELKMENENSLSTLNSPLSTNKTGIPAPMKANFENLSGFSFDDVRVHYNSPKPAQLQALAYTQGSEVHIAPGQEKHLGHELGHVVQQKQGRVQPTMQLQGVNVNDDEGLEKEADLMGIRALRGEETIRQFCPKVFSSNNICQLMTMIAWHNTQPYTYQTPAGAISSINFGSHMEAYLDANNAKKGSSPAGGNQAVARQDAQIRHNGPMVLGHLLNSNLGGPGLDFNLYPISTSANMEHLYRVERHVKNAVMRKVGIFGVSDPATGAHVHYQVQINTTGPAGSGVGVTNANADIFCQWAEYDATTAAWGAINTEVISSIAGDKDEPIIGGWGESGTGTRGMSLPNHLNIYNTAAPLPPGIGIPPWVTTAGFTHIIVQTNGVVVGAGNL